MPLDEVELRGRNLLHRGPCNAVIARLGKTFRMLYRRARKRIDVLASVPRRLRGARIELDELADDAVDVRVAQRARICIGQGGLVRQTAHHDDGIDDIAFAVELEAVG